MVQVELPVAPTLMPTETRVALKKSEMLFPEIVMPLLSTAALVPIDKIASVGKVAPDEVIVLLLMTLPSLPVVVPVLKKIVPTVAAVPEPLMVQFCTVLFVASPPKRIVVEVAPDVVFSIVNVFKPSIVT